VISFSDRYRTDVYNYRGWRPWRGLALIVIGILAGYLTATANQPANHQPPALIDCAR
jgi:hypothetical protein